MKHLVNSLEFEKILPALLCAMRYSLCHAVLTTEGSRTRTGKPSTPKGGLVSVLVDSVMEGIVILLVCILLIDSFNVHLTDRHSQ